MTGARAAYSPGDPRAVQYGGKSADEAPDPPRSSERRVIGDGPLVLSRATLSFWPAFKKLGEHQWDAFARIHGMEVAATLSTLKVNLAHLGERNTWFVRGGTSQDALKLKPGVVRTLIDGLLIDARHLPILLRTLELIGTRERALEKALKDLERAESLERKEPMAETMLQKLESEIDARGLDLTQALSSEQKKDLAAAIGTTPWTLQQVIADLRRLRNNGWSTKKAENGQAALESPAVPVDVPPAVAAEVVIQRRPDSIVEKSSEAAESLPSEYVEPAIVQRLADLLGLDPREAGAAKMMKKAADVIDAAASKLTELSNVRDRWQERAELIEAEWGKTKVELVDERYASKDQRHDLEQARQDRDAAELKVRDLTAQLAASATTLPDYSGLRVAIEEMAQARVDAALAKERAESRQAHLWDMLRPDRMAA